MNKSSVLTEIKRAAKEAPLMYIAPLVGAVRGIQSQYRKLDQQKCASSPQTSQKSK